MIFLARDVGAAPTLTDLEAVVLLLYKSRRWGSSPRKNTPFKEYLNYINFRMIVQYPLGHIRSDSQY